jgi:putative methyltransferase (TIGR04325 family)
MTHTPRVSVILPTYNHAPFVAQAIESVLSQSFADFELIITDDGSQDGTADEIRRFSDPRIRFEAHPANRGYSSALNASISRAHGEFVALHCSDDAFLPGRLQRQVAFLDASPSVAAVFSKAAFVDKDGRPCPVHSNPFHAHFVDDLPDRYAWLRFFLLRGNGLCHPSAMVRRTVYDEVGGYDPLLVQLQDYDFWIRVVGQYEIRVLDGPLVAYRVLGEGLNTSWPGIRELRRTAWETRRVLRRFLAFGPERLERAFGAELTRLGLSPDAPRVAIGRMLVSLARDPARQAFALEILEEAAAQGQAGVDCRDFGRLAGELDPFNLAAVEARRSAEKGLREVTERCEAAERRAAAAEARLAELAQHAAAAAARACELEGRAAAAEARAQAIASSTIWRVTAPLRRLAERQPGVRAAVRQVLCGVLKPGVGPVPVPDGRAAKQDGEIGGNRAGELNERVVAPPHAAGAGEPSAVKDPASGTPAPCRTPEPVSEPPVVPEASLARMDPASAMARPTTNEPSPEWEYVPEGWLVDDPRARGWEHPSVADTQLAKWPAFLQFLRSTAPLGIYHEAAQMGSEDAAAHNFILAFSYVLARAAAGRSSLSVLDWGGGLGHYAAIARTVLPEVRLDYTVFDLPGLCAAGARVQPEVRFTSEPGECLSRRYDLIFASGSLQYAADWRGLLGQFASSAERWVFLSRTPFVDEVPSFVVVQRPMSAGGYRTEYLSWVFNRAELLAGAAAAGLALEREFLMVGERVAAVGASAAFEYRGFLLRPAAEQRSAEPQPRAAARP